MFHLFGEDGQDRVSECQKKKDWAGLAKAYYDMGVAAMDQKDLNRAVLWLHRADTIYSADDAVYDKVGEALVDDCSDRIGELEDAPLLYNQVPMEVEESAEELSDLAVRVWGLLAIARLVHLGERLGRLPGCEVLGSLGWAVDVMLQSFQQPVSQEDCGRLLDICNALYELGDSECFYAGGEIEVAGGAPFEVFDLNGMTGVFLELNCYLDNHLRFLGVIGQEEDMLAAERGMIGCTLLPDYYVRTGSDRPEEVPRVRAELARIWDDYNFICSNITWEQVAQKVDAYKALDILALQ